jgi:hypothetical protein
MKQRPEHAQSDDYSGFLPESLKDVPGKGKMVGWE